MNALPALQTVAVENSSRTPPAMLGLATAWMLAKREWIRFFRQPFRVIAALGQPILFWILFGTGLHGAFRGPESSGSFMTYFLPGTTALILLFTAIFATITIIEDRREGFLQGVLVAPPGRWSIVLGKAIGGAAIAWAQALVFLGLAWCTGSLGLGWNTIPLLAFLFIAALGLSALGVFIAWPMESTQSYHACMNLILMPMWLLSGAFFPIPALSQGQPAGQTVLHWIMAFNPMTYIVGGLRHYLPSTTRVDSVSDPAFWTVGIAESWWVTSGFAALAMVLSVGMVKRRQKGELQ